MKRKAVEKVPFIDIKQVKSLDQGEKYKITVAGNQFCLVPGEDHFNVVYYFKDELQKNIIYFTQTEVGFGFRNWFICNGCQCNRSRLYVLGGVFACRECHRLVYTSSQRSGNDLNYLAWKIRNLQRRLGIEITTFTDIQETPLYKPKYMHQNTFDILRMKLEIMQLHFIEAWLKSCKF